jgi:hypothetical protein
VAGNEQEALVVWTDFRNGTTGDIYGTRIAPDGSLRTATNIEICRAANYQFAPAVAVNGNEYFVVWTDARSSGVNASDIYGAVVSPENTIQPINGFPIRTAVGQQGLPTVVSQGLDYLVAWQESHTAVSNSFDIYAARLNTKNPAEGGHLMLINTNVDNQMVPVVVSGPAGGYAIVNQGIQYASSRTVMNRFDLSALPRLDLSASSVSAPFQYRLQGAKGRSYELRASENLVDWSLLDTITLTTDSHLYTETNNLTGRFYRAILLP